MLFNIHPINLFRSLSLALESSSGGMSRHHWRTAMICSRIAEGLRLDEWQHQLLVYSALLHDIGRAQQYLSGISHDIAGAEIAGKILADLHFTEQEKEEVFAALKKIFTEYHGEHVVYLHMAGRWQKTGPQFWLNSAPGAAEAIEELLGKGAVRQR